MSLFSVFNLFTPAPATPQQVSATNPGTDWLTKSLQVAARLQLQVTDWNSGGVARTIMTIVAWMLSTEDALVSGMAQGGFLDFAATGTVTYVDPTDGVTVIVVPVTVDPSTNPGAAPGWLDILADSGYDCQRIQAAGGANPIVITNTGSSSQTYAAGTYHVTNPSNGLSYSNQTSLTISAASIAGTSITSVSNTSPEIVTTASAHGLSTGAYVYVGGVSTGVNGTYQVTVTGANTFLLNGSVALGGFGAGGFVYVGQSVQFEADIAGPGTSVIGSINQAVTVLPGVQVSNLVALVGTAAESNVALAQRCRDRLASLSPDGPSGAYSYFAKTAYQTVNAITPGAISAPITRVLVAPNQVTGVVQLVVANASGPVTGAVELLVTGATNANPIVVSTAAPHGLASGQVATVSGVQGNPSANGTWTVTFISANSFSIPVAGDGAYTSGGVVEGGDLGQLDQFIQQQCVPDSVTEQTISATSTPVTCSGTIYVAASYAAQAVAAVEAALATYQLNFPVGGVTLPGEGTNIAPYDEILGVAEASLSAIDNIANFKLNGGTSDVAVGAFGLVSFSAFSFTTVGI